MPIAYEVNTTTGELQMARGPAKPGWVPLVDLEPTPLLWRTVILRLDELERAYDALLEVLNDNGIEIGERPRRGAPHQHEHGDDEAP